MSRQEMAATDSKPGSFDILDNDEQAEQAEQARRGPVHGNVFDALPDRDLRATHGPAKKKARLEPASGNFLETPPQLKVKAAGVDNGRAAAATAAPSASTSTEISARGNPDPESEVVTGTASRGDGDPVGGETPRHGGDLFRETPPTNFQRADMRGLAG
jgi:hypothetical protein